jgi:DNA-binding YbaB/EbfC family protein
MNMQQMLMQAQKMQREMQKKQAELEAQEFTVSKGGAVTVVVKGDKSIVSISIDKDAMDPDNKEMVEELVALAINEAIEQIKAKEAEISSSVSGGMGGLF